MKKRYSYILWSASAGSDWNDFPELKDYLLSLDNVSEELSKKEEKILYCINSNSIENIAYITIVNENYWEKNKCISEYPPKWVEKGYFIPNKFLYLGNSTWKVVLGDKFKNTEEIKKFLEFNPKMIYSKELENFINKN